MNSSILVLSIYGVGGGGGNAFLATVSKGLRIEAYNNSHVEVMRAWASTLKQWLLKAMAARDKTMFLSTNATLSSFLRLLDSLKSTPIQEGF